MQDENENQRSSAILKFSLAALLLWLFYRPLKAVVSLIIRATLLSIRPTLIILGFLKAYELSGAGREAANLEPESYPGDDESMASPANVVATVPPSAEVVVP